MSKIRCPIAGCPKKGAPSALAAHAKVKHPEVPSATYQAMLDGGPFIASGPSLAVQPTRTTPRNRSVLWILGVLLTGLVLTGVAAYISTAI